MTIDIESRTVTVGNGVSGFAWGFWSNPSIGSAFGSIDNAVSKIHGNNNYIGVFWVANDLYLYIDEIHANAVWDTLEIGGTSFSRTSATFGRILTGGLSIVTTWEWATGTNPFGTTASATKTVKLKQSGYVPANGPITLDQIHQEAGGSSGSSVTINDSDVRAKSWYATIAGSTPASGATQEFTDFYYPSQINDTPIARRVDNSATGGSTDGTTDRSARILTSGIGKNATHTGDYSVTVEATSTDTFIKVRSGNPGTKSVYDQSGNVIGTSLMEYLWKSTGFPITSAALLTTQTYISPTSPPSGWSFSTNFNATPAVGTHMSTNSATSFVSTSANTEYGRKISTSITTDNDQEDIFTKIYTTRFDWVLRREPSGLATSIDKDYYMSFLIHHSHFVVGEE